MADSIPSETESSVVDLLIGNDYYLDIILTQEIEVLTCIKAWLDSDRSIE